jgi:ketosteroid isomerase-like protein
MPQTGQTSSYAAGTIAETITNLEHEWAAAVKAGDSAKVMPLLSENFIEMDSEGALHNGSEILDWIKHSQWQICEISEVKVNVHGNMAIATGLWRGKGTSPDGKPVDAHERWLDTWLRNGKWHCVASASAPAKA